MVVATIETALPAAVAVVGRDRRAVAAGCAAGLLLARRARAPAALVCVRGAGDGRLPAHRGAATLGARRLATAVGADGVAVAAAGRLVLADLDRRPGDGEGRIDGAVAVARAERALAAAGNAPTVLVLAGPREASFDRLLAAQDVIGVACAAGDPPSLADLAVAGLPGAAVALRCGTARAAASLACGGVAVAPSLAAAVAPLIAGLS